MTEHAAAQTAHHAAAGSEAHAELPNLITVLKELFPHAGWVHFLHQWENVFFSMLVVCLIASVFLYAARARKMVPSGLQNFCELVMEAISGFVTGILGPRGVKHIPFLGTLFVYVLLMNWSGLFPLMKSSTASWSTTIALAICGSAGWRASFQSP